MYLSIDLYCTTLLHIIFEEPTQTQVLLSGELFKSYVIKLVKYFLCYTCFIMEKINYNNNV